MPKGNPYSFIIAPRTELGMLIDVASGTEKVAKYDFVLRIVLEHFKEQFIKDYGEDAFNEYYYYLSIPSLVKKKQKQAEKNKKNKSVELKERELTIREENLGIRKQKSRSRETSLKLEIAKCDRMIKEAQENLNDNGVQYWERRKKKTEGELADLKEVKAKNETNATINAK